MTSCLFSKRFHQVKRQHDLIHSGNTIFANICSNMSWMNLFGNSSSTAPKSNIPPPTALQQQRAKQIETLQTFHHSVTEVQRDVEYRVTFNVGASTVFLNVSLPPQFPQDKPVVKVSPPVRHPWVNDQMLVAGCQALNNFYMHSSLGKAVQEVVREFCEHPPQFISQSSSGPHSSAAPVGGYQSSSTYSFPGYQPLVTPFSSSQYGTSNTGPITFPSTVAETTTLIPTDERETPKTRKQQIAVESEEFPELNGLGLEELKNLNDEPELIEEFFKTMETAKQLKEEKQRLIFANEDIARYNLSLQPELESCKDAILNNYELLNERQQEFARRNQIQKDLIAAYSLSNIHTSLEVAAAQAEQESDEIADEFLEGKMKIDEFIQKFIEKRKIGHLRRAKEEKLRTVHTRF